MDQDGNIAILKRPDGATDMEIYPETWEALADQYDGSWAFEVPLEPATGCFSTFFRTLLHGRAQSPERGRLPGVS